MYFNLLVSICSLFILKGYVSFFFEHSTLPAKVLRVSIYRIQVSCMVVISMNSNNMVSLYRIELLCYMQLIAAICHDDALIAHKSLVL